MRFTLLIAILFWTAASTPVHSQTLPISADTTLSLQLDVTACRADETGSQIVSGFASGLAAALAADPESATADEMIQAFGFDPIAETRRVTLLCGDIDRPRQTTSLIIQLGRTTGNLEGMLMTMPGYQSESRDGHTMHSITLDGDRIVAAVHTDRGGNKRVIGSLDADCLRRVLSHLNGRASNQSSRSLDQNTGNLLDFQLFEIPQGIASDPPFQAIAQLVRQMQCSIEAARNRWIVHARLTTDSDQQAEQLRQMITGTSAMVRAMSRSDQSPQAQLTRRLLADLAIQQEGASVTLSLPLSQATVIDQLSGAW